MLSKYLDIAVKYLGILFDYLDILVNYNHWKLLLAFIIPIVIIQFIKVSLQSDSNKKVAGILQLLIIVGCIVTMYYILTPTYLALYGR